MDLILPRRVCRQHALGNGDNRVHFLPYHFDHLYAKHSVVGNAFYLAHLYLDLLLLLCSRARNVTVYIASVYPSGDLTSSVYLIKLFLVLLRTYNLHIMILIIIQNGIKYVSYYHLLAYLFDRKPKYIASFASNSSFPSLVASLLVYTTSTSYVFFMIREAFSQTSSSNKNDLLVQVY